MYLQKSQNSLNIQHNECVKQNQEEVTWNRNVVWDFITNTLSLNYEMESWKKK